MKITPTHTFWILLGLVVISFLWRVYAETRPPVGPLGYNHWFVDMRGKGPSYDEHEKLVNQVAVASKEIPAKKPLQVVRKERTTQLQKETIPFDLDKFAIAVSYAETGGGKKGSAITHNNAFGIMTWDKNGKRSFKRYATLEDSYTDFKRIWRDKYGNKYPTRRHAEVWTGKDRVDNWLRIVGSYYYQ